MSKRAIVIVVPKGSEEQLDLPRAIQLYHAMMTRTTYRTAMLIVIPQLFIAFLFTLGDQTAHATLCAVLGIGLFSAFVRGLFAWATERAAGG